MIRLSLCIAFLICCSSTARAQFPVFGPSLDPVYLVAPAYVPPVQAMPGTYYPNQGMNVIVFNYYAPPSPTPKVTKPRHVGEWTIQDAREYAKQLRKP